MSRQGVEEFRARVRGWLEANAPQRSADDGSEDVGSSTGIDAQRAFQARLYDAGFAGITWPAEYGG